MLTIDGTRDALHEIANIDGWRMRDRACSYLPSAMR